MNGLNDKKMLNKGSDFAFKTQDKLFINAYHPSYFKKEEESYCNEIIGLGKQWKSEK